MKILETNVAVGVGDLIYIKAQLDAVKHQFDQINITFDNWVINHYCGNRPDYIYFLNDIGKLFFSEHPYNLNIGNYKFRGQLELYSDYGCPPVKPQLKNILCKGDSLNIKKYFVINTKTRYFSKNDFNIIYEDFWKIINKLSEKYQIVILGERVVEENIEYKIHGSDIIYSFYYDIIKNINKNKLIDLTVPALGIKSPNLIKIQQDCLIMSQADFVINLGIGGSFCMATATSNTICYRRDGDLTAEMMFGDSKTYPDALITKKWKEFSNKLENYI